MKKIIERVLNKYGYYKSDMPDGSVVTEAEILEMFNAYGTNEVFKRFLRDICANDVRTYFQATSEEDRRLIRGVYQRTSYFIALINKSNRRKRIESNTRRKRSNGSTNTGRTKW